jgi:hypothetical protein
MVNGLLHIVEPYNYDVCWGWADNVSLASKARVTEIYMRLLERLHKPPESAPT